MQDQDLEALFQSARAVPDMPDALLQQIARQGIAAQPIPTVAPQQPRFFLMALLGGWRGMGGLVAACAVGVMIGFVAPATWVEQMPVLAQYGGAPDILGTDMMDLYFMGEDG